MESPRIQRALISVSDKTGLAEFSQRLAKAGVEIFSTGGTAKFLKEQGLTVRDVSAYTGFPEMMDGRLKTLHPKVFGGILCRPDHGGDLNSIQEHGISTFELVVVNLYPFEKTVAKEHVTWDEAIEQIDIGGPSLARAAAKNHAFVTVATDCGQYGEIADAIQRDGCTTRQLRQRLAAEAFARTARYDQAISQFFHQHGLKDDDLFPEHFHLPLTRKVSLRYGENPHQQAALYRDDLTGRQGIVSGKQLNGKELSYNNILDLDAALAIARSLPDHGAVVIKHTNPCGAASANTSAQAVAKALAGDPVSAFGSIIGFNQSVDLPAAEILCQPGLFIEAIVAPSFDPAAVELLTTRPKWKENVRLVEIGPFGPCEARTHMRQIEGGFLVQQADVLPDSEGDWHVVTRNRPTDDQMSELRFAWILVRHVKSNAISITRDRTLWGVGAGQMSRVDSVEIAIKKSGDNSRGAVLASDAFFPFSDSIERAWQAGITAIIQPGGSRRDDEVIAKCDECGLSMVFTGRRHFKH
jgi:phosphoribosylaminoimidazolecarboxamide formyltransferase/IMP cyclohydrolase